MRYKKRIKGSASNTAAFIRCVAIGVLTGALFLCLMLLLFSGVIVLTKSLPSEYALICIKTFTMLSAVSCGYISARMYKSKGILIGTFSAFILAFLLFIYKAMNAALSFEVNILVKIIIMLLCGAIGGVLGVNANAHRKKLYK